jgi:hypothetical protein
MSQVGEGGGGESANEQPQQAPQQQQASSRIRSRFPKAQPNIALSSGLARIRRLSGHFQPEPTDVVALEKPAPVATPPPQSSASPLPPPIISTSTQNLIESVLSPSIQRRTSVSTPVPASADDIENVNLSLASGSPSMGKSLASPLRTQTFRQFLNSPASVVHNFSQPTTPLIASVATPHTPGGSLYKPKFSKEHINNIIKFKAMQKLKKNESEVGLDWISCLFTFSSASFFSIFLCPI